MNIMATLAAMPEPKGPACQTMDAYRVRKGACDSNRSLVAPKEGDQFAPSSGGRTACDGGVDHRD